MTVYADARWTGVHGIGRYATEVLARCPQLHIASMASLRTSSPVDVLNAGRLGLRASDTLYCPGYGAGFTLARQVLTVHDLIHLSDKDERDVKKALYYKLVVRPTILRAGVVFTVSETSKRALEEWLDEDEVDVVVTGNGVSEAFVNVDTTTAASNGRLLYVGSAKPHKNLRTILRALNLTPEIELTIVSSEAQLIDEWAQDIGVSERLRLHEGVSDQSLASMYRDCQGLLMPSTLEGFGLPAAEAISCGAPVLYWQGCESVAEIVGEYGIATTSATDVDEWATAMVALSRSDRINPTATWKSRYDWESVAHKVRVALGVDTP